MGMPGGKKHKYAMQWGMTITKPNWITDSIEKGFAQSWQLNQYKGMWSKTLLNVPHGRVVPRRRRALFSFWPLDKSINRQKLPLAVRHLKKRPQPKHVMLLKIHAKLLPFMLLKTSKLNSKSCWIRLETVTLQMIYSTVWSSVWPVSINVKGSNSAKLSKIEVEWFSRKFQVQSPTCSPLELISIRTQK